MKYLDYKGKSIRYQVKGQGRKALVLLHGYLESLEVWSDFSDLLEAYYKVISIDIPGHGKSEIVQSQHDMNLLADVVHRVIQSEGIDQFTLIGHSLGGYVTLAYLEHFPDNLEGVVLFHSHPFADSEQVKTNRQREIEFVNQGKKKVIINTNIPKAFANENLERFKDSVELVRQIALETPDEGIVANLKGMMNRPDRSHLVKNTSKPILLIAGLADNYINYEQVIPEVILPVNGQLVTLERSGHMGFIEEKEKALFALRTFLDYENRETLF